MYCPACLRSMEEQGLDASAEADRTRHAEQVLDMYYQRTVEAARHSDPNMAVFHNSGHIPRGERNRLKYFSHLELESLPTGGWGYDNFPLSARYTAGLDLDVLGMTGKFHTTWGEFGGYKHPNALRYECAAMIAHGAKCSVGDQLHPEGRLDPSTYALIGQAYAEVEAKEPWCSEVESVADIGLLSSTAVNPSGERDNAADTGAARMLLESHLLFDVLDTDMDFSPYKVLLLPDDIQVGSELKKKLDAYLDGGGRLILSGRSGVNEAGTECDWDLGADLEGPSPYEPDYLLADPRYAPDFCASPMIMYQRSRRLRVTSGRSIGAIVDPYFNRTYRHFCSHQHTPPNPAASGYDGGVMTDQILYFAHPVFSTYAAYGAVACRQFVERTIRAFLGDSVTLETSLPSTGRVTLMHQPEDQRYVLHLLYAPTVARGGTLSLSGGTTSNRKSIEVIEDIPSIHDVKIALRLPADVKSAHLQPQDTSFPFEMKDGILQCCLEQLDCHQMIVFT